jgi:hypothetical protein
MNKIIQSEIKRSEKKKRSIGANLLKNNEIPSPSRVKREDFTKIIDKLVISKRGPNDNKLYQFMTKSAGKRTSLIQTFFTENIENQNQVMLTTLKRKDIETQAQEEYTMNKRTHNLEYNRELRNVLLNNYKRFKFPKVLTKSEKYLMRFESYSHINQRDVNLGLILDNMKKNYIKENKGKPKFFLSLKKPVDKSSVDYKINTIQSILKKNISLSFPNIKTIHS